MTRRTAKNPLFSGQKVVKRSSRESVGRAIPALDITPDVGGPVMPVDGNIPQDAFSAIRTSANKKTRSKAETSAVLHMISESVDYDAETGKFTWRERPKSHFASVGAWRSWNSQFPGSQAFSTRTPKGYLVGAFKNANFLSHRVAWAVKTGSWPVNGIDHINGVRDDNRFFNLREATQAQNMQNKLIHRLSDRAAGVSLKGARWRSGITLDGRHYFLGSFGTEAEAKAARQAAERVLGFWMQEGEN